MGILKSREQLLPMTCAVLKEEERARFFAQAKKQVNGSLERIAHICGSSVSSVSDWISGKTNIPYHTLQSLARALGLEPPAVSELRREFQEVSMTPSPGAAKASKAWLKPRESKKPQQKKERAKPPRQKVAKAAAQRAPRKPAHPPAAPRTPAKESAPKAPKLSAKLAYWTGTIFAAGLREADAIVFRPERGIGQNFAATWASLTKELFDSRSTLEMKDPGKTQEARVEVRGFAEFLDRLEFKPGAAPADAPAAPRWAWSNPEWKTSFLKGVVDACARFHRTPELRLEGLSLKLAKSVQKMLSSNGLEPKILPDGSLALEGREAVEKYFATIGTANLKLKDQLNAYLRNDAAPGSATEPDASGQPQKPTRRGRRLLFIGRPRPKR